LNSDFSIGSDTLIRVFIYLFFIYFLFYPILVKFLKLNLSVPRIGREPQRNCPGTHPCRNPNGLKSHSTKRQEMDK
jgi:hypothetical protein